MSGAASNSDETLLARVFLPNRADVTRISIDLWRLNRGKRYEYVVWTVNHDYGERGGRNNGLYTLPEYHTPRPCLISYIDQMSDDERAKLDDVVRIVAYKAFFNRVADYTMLIKTTENEHGTDCS